MAIQNRQELKDYALRALGYPLVEVDITEEAQDDRIDEAIYFFAEHYYDGSNRFFWKYQVTQTDIDNGYITVPQQIWGIVKVYPLSNSITSAVSIFDVQYQLRQADVRNITSQSLIYYSQVMQHLALIDEMFTQQMLFRFNRNTDKLYIDTSWKTRIAPDSYLLIDCYTAIDPETDTKFWNNRQFKEYVIALFKKQWARAYSKYNQITLPGGATIDGQSMYQEAVQEIQEIEDNIINNSAPLEFYSA